VKSYYGYLRKAYTGNQQNSEFSKNSDFPKNPPEDDEEEMLPQNNQNRRFFFDFGGGGLGSGFSGFVFGSDKDEKERCQFKPYYYDNYGDGGFSG
jgi:hypothetical protein